MGRETKILLALLATLSGVFMGVLAMKLLVPRPPAGAGADVHAEVAAARPIELVEPPALDPATPLRPRFAPPTADEIAAVDRPGVRLSTTLPVHAADEAAPPSFAASRPPRPLPEAGPEAVAAADAPSDDPAPPRRDPFVTRAAFDGRSVDVAAASPTPAPGRFGDTIPGQSASPPPAAVPTRETLPPPAAATSLLVGYECLPGDSWWSLAERAYGDGRLYRALFAWNRTLDPRVSLVPGTRLELPPRERLESAWPKLVPAPTLH